MKPEAHQVLGSIEGAVPEAAWVEDGHWSRIDVCVELHDGERLAYVGGVTENGRTVRVDLDRDGWERLRDLSAGVLQRIDAAAAAEHDGEQA